MMDGLFWWSTITFQPSLAFDIQANSQFLLRGIGLFLARSEPVRGFGPPGNIYTTSFLRVPLADEARQCPTLVSFTPLSKIAHKNTPRPQRDEAF